MPQSKGIARLPFDGKKRDSDALYNGLSAHAARVGGARLAAPPSLATSGNDGDDSHATQRDSAGRQALKTTRLCETASVPSDTQLTRQLLRAIGFNEIRRRCKVNFPRYNRKEINQLARKLHDEAWKRRDKDAVARVKRG